MSFRSGYIRHRLCGISGIISPRIVLRAWYSRRTLSRRGILPRHRLTTRCISLRLRAGLPGLKCAVRHALRILRTAVLLLPCVISLLLFHHLFLLLFVVGLLLCVILLHSLLLLDLLTANHLSSI